MNIFVLDLDPKKCAEYHCDKHVVKMILESAQLLCNAHHLQYTILGDLYQATHMNHPCAVWVRKSTSNYDWLASLGIELCLEYQHRYGKTHKTTNLMCSLRDNYPLNLPIGELTPFAQAMPDVYKNEDVVKAYQSYYINEKKHILKYTKQNIPDFLL